MLPPDQPAELRTVLPAEMSPELLAELPVRLLPELPGELSAELPAELLGGLLAGQPLESCSRDHPISRMLDHCVSLSLGHFLLLLTTAMA